MHQVKPLLGLVLALVTLFLLPGQGASATTRDYSFDLGPGDDTADVYVYLVDEQWATVTAAFNQSEELADMKVWAIAQYQYPTKTLGETVGRFEGVQWMEFKLGADNVTRIMLFFVRFIVRFFYHGEMAAHVNVTVTIHGDSASSATSTDLSTAADQLGTNLQIAGVGAVAAAALVFAAVVKTRRFRILA